jgi:hypothetical protein
MGLLELSDESFMKAPGSSSPSPRGRGKIFIRPTERGKFETSGGTADLLCNQYNLPGSFLEAKSELPPSKLGGIKDSKFEA